MAKTFKKVNHPIFARWIYPAVSAKSEASGTADHRRRLLAGLSGRVIEVGAGTGLNFGHYPPSVTEVIATEPESHLRGLAEKAAKSAPVPVRVIDALAEELPAEAPFDAGVVSLVLCSVYEPSRALAELFRVIRPGGELRFFEHVLATSPVHARVQRVVDRLFWPRVSGGCHASRETSAAIEAAGFVIEDILRFIFRPSFVLFAVSPHILGRARRP